MPNANPELIADPERLESLRRLCLLDTPADPDFDRLTRLACRILDAPIALVSLVDERRQFFKSETGMDEPWASRREMPLNYSYCQHVVASGSPLIIDDSLQNPLVADNRSTMELHIQSYAGIPLTTSDGKVLGSFCVMDKKTRVWTEEEVGILTDLAASVMTEIELRGQLIEHRRVENALQQVEEVQEQTVQRLTLLRRIQVELSESLDLDSVLTIAMDTAQRASGAEHGFIGLIGGDQLHLIHTAGNYVNGMVWESSRGVIGRALKTGEPQIVLDVDDDPDFIFDIPGIRAQMVIPLIHREHLIGVINLKTSKPKLFTQDAFDFLAMVAGHITVAIDNAQLYQVSQQQLEELHLLYMRVSELEELKTDMIRIAAHDLRNPLGVVKASAELLLEDGELLAPDQRAFIESIAQAGQRMLKIINDILSLQRVEAMQNNGNCDSVDLIDLSRSVFTANERMAQQKEQVYRLVLPQDAVPICVDVAQLREAMENLISNAIKYTPKGGAITVRVAQDEDSAVFEVEDTGFGIPEDQQTRLFHPFFRASNAKASGVEGTGLGLHLVKNIVERHSGKMRFHSVQGGGSVFGFELPQKLG